VCGWLIAPLHRKCNRHHLESLDDVIRQSHFLVHHKHRVELEWKSNRSRIVVVTNASPASVQQSNRHHQHTNVFYRPDDNNSVKALTKSGLYI